MRTRFYSEIGGKDKTLVKNDCIDLGIGELEKEISCLTQKLAELKLQNACETPSQVIGIQHKSNDKNTPMRIENNIETRNGPREWSSEKRKEKEGLSLLNFFNIVRNPNQDLRKRMKKWRQRAFPVGQSLRFKRNVGH